MQNNEQSLLLIHRENYKVPKGQEHSVHCKVAKLDASGNFIEKARVVCFGAKKFDAMIKDNLETMGYTIEILYHPMGKYSNVVIKDKDVELKAKDAEIEALRKALEEAEAKAASTKVEPKVDEADVEVKEEKKKAGRPKKEE